MSNTVYFPFSLVVHVLLFYCDGHCLCSYLACVYFAKVTILSDSLSLIFLALKQ